MKINKAQFDDYLNRIRELVNSYINESNDYKYNNYMLFLANGEVIKYSFNDNNIPHLLGIDFTSLISRNEIDKNDSIDMLYQILDDPYKYWNIVNKTNSNELFSDYIEDKITNFRYQIMVPYPNQLYFVCKYDRTKAYGLKQIDGLNADYYIARNNELGDVVLLGLVKRGNVYVPQSSRIIKNDEKFMTNMEKFLANQEITYVNGLSFICEKTGYSRNVNLNILETLEILQKINDLTSSTSSIPNVLDNYIYNLKILSKNKNESSDARKILRSINESMKNKKIIELTQEELEILDSSVVSVIESYNDSLFNTFDNKENTLKYSELKKENNNLEETISIKNKTIEEQKQELKQLKEELLKLKQDNEKLNDEKENFEELKKTLKLLSNKYPSC